MAHAGLTADLRCARKAVVVGFGNTLRGDDALGPYTVESLRDMPLFHGAAVSAIVLPQLDVTLAADVYDADLLILVDARTDEDEELVRVERVEPSPGLGSKPPTSHTIGVPDLLYIMRAWYGGAPACFTVMPKGYDFSIGDALSEKAQVAAVAARERVVDLLESALTRHSRNQERRCTLGDPR